MKKQRLSRAWMTLASAAGFLLVTSTVPVVHAAGLRVPEKGAYTGA